MTDEADVIEQDSRRPLPRLWRTMLVAMAAVIAVAAAGICVAVARPWYHRTSFPDPCRLLPAATVAKYVPGAAKAVAVTFASTTQQHGQCEWSTTSRLLALYAEDDATANGARRDFDSALGSLSEGLTKGSTSRAVSGLGDQARATVLSIDPSQPQVTLLVRSGATMLVVTYAAPHAAGAEPAATAGIADAVAIARAALGNYAAAPAASSILIAAVPSGGPRYAPPVNACHLLFAAAVTRYLGGAARGSPSDNTGCYWTTANGGSLAVGVSEFSPGADGSPDEQAQQTFQMGLESAVQSGIDPATILGSRNILDVGSYAGAVLENGVNGATVALFAWSGNAEINVTLTSGALLAPDDAELSSAIAAARDVFNALPQASAAS